jgi:hypothetical protein
MTIAKKLNHIREILIKLDVTTGATPGEEPISVVMGVCATYIEDDSTDPNTVLASSISDNVVLYDGRKDPVVDKLTAGQKTSINEILALVKTNL